MYLLTFIVNLMNIYIQNMYKEKYTVWKTNKRLCIKYTQVLCRYELLNEMKIKTVETN